MVIMPDLKQHYSPSSLEWHQFHDHIFVARANTKPSQWLRWWNVFSTTWSCKSNIYMQPFLTSTNWLSKKDCESGQLVLMCKTGFLGAWPDDKFLVSKNNPLSHYDSGAEFARKYSAIHDVTIPNMYLEPKWNPLVLNGVWAFLWRAQTGSNTKIEDIHRFQVCISILYTETSENLLLKTSRSSTTSSEHRHALHHTFTIQVALLLPNQTCQLLRIHETNSRSTVKATICRIVGPKGS